MAEQRSRVNLITAVWGDWHLNAFLSLNIPTLLAAGNLPSLSETCEVNYDLYTRAADVERIRHSQGFRSIERFMAVRIHPISEEFIADPLRAHREVWFEAAETAKREQAYVLLMPPDVAWSDGSFRHVAKLIEDGKKVIYNFYMRVVSDTFSRELVQHDRNVNGVIAIPPRELVDLAMHHINPLMAAYCRDSANFPYHAEFVIWPVSKEGLLIRVLARECLLYDPNSYSLNSLALPDGFPDPAEIEFVSNSDDFFAVSLAPLGKDIEWCLQRQRVEHTWLSRWWLYYDSALNDLTASAKIRIHHVEPTVSKWRQVEFASDLFVRRVAMYREALRTWRALNAIGCRRSADLLALAIRTGAVTHLTGAQGRMIVFAPSDEGFDLIPAHRFEDDLRGGLGQSLKDLIRSHLVMLSDIEPELETRLASGAVVELTALDGNTKIRVRAVGSAAEGRLPSMVVNGTDARESMRAGRNWIIQLDGAIAPAVSTVAHQAI